MKENKTRRIEQREQRAIRQQQQHTRSSSVENLISKPDSTYTTPHSLSVAEGA